MTQSKPGSYGRVPQGTCLGLLQNTLGEGAGVGGGRADLQENQFHLLMWSMDPAQNLP